VRVVDSDAIIRMPLDVNAREARRRGDVQGAAPDPVVRVRARAVPGLAVEDSPHDPVHDQARPRRDLSVTWPSQGTFPRSHPSARGPALARVCARAAHELPGPALGALQPLGIDHEEVVVRPGVAEAGEPRSRSGPRAPTGNARGKKMLGRIVGALRIHLRGIAIRFVAVIALDSRIRDGSPPTVRAAPRPLAPLPSPMSHAEFAQHCRRAAKPRDRASGFILQFLPFGAMHTRIRRWRLRRRSWR